MQSLQVCSPRKSKSRGHDPTPKQYFYFGTLRAIYSLRPFPLRTKVYQMPMHLSKSTVKRCFAWGGVSSEGRSPCSECIKRPKNEP